MITVFDMSAGSPDAEFDDQFVKAPNKDYDLNSEAVQYWKQTSLRLLTLDEALVSERRAYEMVRIR